MTERKSMLTLTALLWSWGALAAPAPGPVPGTLVPEVDLRAFANHDDATGMVELSGRAEPEGRQPRSVMAGAYYRFLENLRVGAFYERRSGYRLDGDWQKIDGTWQWIDPNTRGENVFVLDATPRLQFGDNWLAELRSRLFFDTTAGFDTYQVRPGLTYFWFREGKPFMSYFLQCELAFPLNYGKLTINEKWLYLGALHHLSPAFQVGLYGAIKWEGWSSDAVFDAANSGLGFTTGEANPVLGLVGIYQFDL